MKNTNKMLMMAACTLLLVMGTNIIPMQSFADRGDYKDEKGNDLKSKLSAIAESDKKRAGQEMDQDNLCYRGDDCEQANQGQQIVGKDNDAEGFNDQSSSNTQQTTTSTTPGNGTTPAPMPQTGTLLVTKNVSCAWGFTCPQPSAFTMHVTGTSGNGNPNPSSFAGSADGTTVTLNVGRYDVSETFQANASAPLKVVQHFDADCSDSIDAAGESKKCSVINEFKQKKYVFLLKWGSFGTADGQFDDPQALR